MIQQAIVQVLQPIYEPLFSENSYGFRQKELHNRQYQKHIKDERVISLIQKYLKSGVMINGLVSPTTEGTLQGGNLSPLLSNIYVKSLRAAERVMKSCVKFLEGKLKLKVNQEKSKVGSPLKLKFLGFSLYKTGKKTGIRPHGKSIKRFKNKIRELTSRKQARSDEQILKCLNEWIKCKIRQIYWKQWKKVSARFSNLKKLDINVSSTEKSIE